MDDPVLAFRTDEVPDKCVPIAELRLGETPRQDGTNVQHTRLLAESGAVLPPILVHSQTMRVIDGAHRFHAAVLRGEQDIRVQFFSGTERDAFVLAVKANTAHGLPLTFADRTAAAERIVRSHPQWSDRAIATVTNLAHQTVGDIRRRLTGDDDQLHTARVGRDGKVRLLDTAAARRRAGELLLQEPQASLRQIARMAGISPGTVRDVRNRLVQGHDLVPQKRAVTTRTRHPEKANGDAVRPVCMPSPTDLDRNMALILQVLRRDPSLRFSDSGRALLRLLNGYALVAGEGATIARSVPPHCSREVAGAARAYAHAWLQLAEQIERGR